MTTISRSAGRTGILAVVLTVLAVPTRADDLVDWLAGEHATGDWGGLRNTLEEAGITPELAYTTDLMAVHNGNAGSGEGWG